MVRHGSEPPYAAYLVERIAIPHGFRPETNQVAVFLEFTDDGLLLINGESMGLTDEELQSVCDLADTGMVGSRRDYPPPGTSWTATPPYGE
jgi:hypothetical protein